MQKQIVLHTTAGDEIRISLESGAIVSAHWAYIAQQRAIVGGLILLLAASLAWSVVRRRRHRAIATAAAAP